MKNKTIIFCLVVIIVIVGGVFLLFQNKTPIVIDTNALASEQKELVALDANFALFAGDEVILSELNQTFNDLAETIDAINADESIDNASINQEANQIDSSKDLTNFMSEEATLQELDQVFDEVTQ